MSRFKHLVKITRPAYRKICLAIIGFKSNTKLTKYEIRSSYCLRQFGFIYPYLIPKYHFRLYLELLICICHYSPIFGLIYLITPIWSYLLLIALILQYVPYSPNIPWYVFFYWENYSWRYCTSKNLGMQKVLTRMQFVCLFSHWQPLGYTECRLAVNTVVLECSECQISIATNIRV